jgi:uncharacterized membrane protein HdeD (DUF308 family)
VVGNAAYQHTAPLKNPANDARSIDAALRELGFEIIGGAQDGIDLDYGAMAARIRDFGRRLQEDFDVALLFYAGHGLQAYGRNYLVPIDAALETEADVGRELYELQHILNQMERPGRTSLVFLDACRNNPLTRNLTRAMGLSDTRSAEVKIGLAEQKAAAGTLIAYATQPDHVAYDGAGINGYFTEGLLRHLSAPDREVELMLKDVRATVLEATKMMRQGPQVPWVHSSLTGAFYFRPETATQIAPAQISPLEALSPSFPHFDERLVEHTRWQSVKNSRDPNELEWFLTKHPGGIYAEDAERAWKRAVAECSDHTVLEEYLNNHGGSPRASAAQKRLATLEQVAVGAQIDLSNQTLWKASRLGASRPSPESPALVLALAQNWWLLLLRSIAAIVFLVLLILQGNAPSLLTLMQFYGAFALVDGIVAVVAAMKGRGAGPRRWLALVGIAGVLAGALTFLWPGGTTLVLRYLIAGWAIAVGIFEIVGATKLRRESNNEWLLMAAGVTSVLFGVVMLMSVADARDILAVMIGYYALIHGGIWLSFALRLRKAAPSSH